MTNTFIQSVFVNLANNNNVYVNYTFPKDVSKCIIRQITYAPPVGGPENILFFIKSSLTRDYIASIVTNDLIPNFSSCPNTVLNINSPLTDRIYFECINQIDPQTPPAGFLGLILEFHK